MKRNDVLNELYGSRFWKDVKVDFISEAKRIRTMKEQAEFLNKYSFYLLYESPMNTIKGRGLEMRKALIQGGISEDNPILNFFKIQSNIYENLNKKYDNERKEKLLNGDDNNISYTDIAEKTIKELINNIEHNDVLNISNNSKKSRELAYQKMIVLALATGRRQIEILKMLEISKKKENALYKNLAKKKESDSDSIIAPIFIDVNIAKKYLKAVKEEFSTENMTNKQVNSKYNGSISKALYRYLNDDIAKRGFHFLRAIYAESCYEKFGNGADKNIYFQKVLGHEIKINAGHSYQAKTKGE